MSNVELNLETIEVSADMAAKVARIADLNESARLIESEGKALKAEVTEAVGGADMVAVFPEGIRVTHGAVAIATVMPTTRATISAEGLAQAIESVLAAFPALAEDHSEAVAAIRGLTTTAAKVTTYPVVRTK
jgi:hypothetical protein